MELTKKELKKFWSFLVETFEFTEEQSDAIHHFIPMTQELFDSIINRCNEIGSDANDIFFKMLDEYPDFLCVHADKIEEEVQDMEGYTLSEEEWAIQKEKLYARIRAEYGEDAI